LLPWHLVIAAHHAHVAVQACFLPDFEYSTNQRTEYNFCIQNLNPIMMQKNDGARGFGANTS
jgi:hypothetical protein